MNRQLERYLQIIFFTLDIIGLNLVYLIFQLIFTQSIHFQSTDAYFKYAAVANISWFLLAFLLRTYAASIILNFEAFTKRTIQVFLIWMISILFYLFFSRELVVSRFFIITTTVAFGLSLLINKFIYLGVFRYFKNSDLLVKKIIILGYNETAKKLATYFEQDVLNTEIIGYIEDEENIQELSHYPVLADIEDTLTVAKNLDAQEIFSTITPEQNNFIYDLMYQSEKECIRFRIVPNLSVFITREVHIEYYGDLPILSLRKEPLDDVGNRIKKRALDLDGEFIGNYFYPFMVDSALRFINLLRIGDAYFF